MNGSFNASLCNRNSRIGLGSPRIGTLFLGNWDTPHKSGIFGTKADDPFYSTDAWDHESILTRPGFNTKTSGWVTNSNTTITSFAVRNNNTIAFHSASFSAAGVDRRESHPAPTSNQPVVPAGADPRALGLGIRYAF